MNRLVCGVGINDTKGMSREIVNGKSVATKAYRSWSDMINRCYNKKVKGRQKCYVGCSVCDDWLYFSSFKKWFDNNYIEGWQLDKDLLVSGNKIYSPEFCNYVPRRVNSLFGGWSKDKDLPIGVSKVKGFDSTYQVSLMTTNGSKWLGYFDNPIDAKSAYDKERSEYVRSVLSSVARENGENKRLLSLIDILINRVL